MYTYMSNITYTTLYIIFGNIGNITLVYIQINAL